MGKKNKTFPGLFLRGKTWWIRIQPHGNGKRIRESLHTRDRTEAEKKYLELHHQLTNKTYIRQQKESVARFLAEQRTSLKINKTFKTAERYSSMLQAFERYVSGLGIKNLDDIDYEVAVGFRDLRLQERAPKTVAEELTFIKALFTEAVNLGRIRQNPFLNVKKPKIVNRPPRPFTQEELDKIFELITYQDYRDKYLFLLHTGLRCGEMLQLEKADFNLQEGYLRVRMKSYWIPKDSEERIIYLDKVAEEIASRRFTTRSRWLFLKDHYMPQGEVAFGKYLRVCVCKAGGKWREALRKVGIFDANMHSLRKTFGCRLYKSSKNILAVMKIMGHSSWDVSRHYITVGDEELKQIMNDFT